MHRSLFGLDVACLEQTKQADEDASRKSSLCVVMRRFSDCNMKDRGTHHGQEGPVEQLSS